MLKFTARLILMNCLALAFSSISIQTFAQTGPVPPGLAAALQARLDQVRISNNRKGMSAALIIPGQGIWRGANGVSHDTVAIDTAMVFPIASVTKTFISTTILLLEEDNLLSINDSLHKWLPPYPNVNPDITIKQLLQNRSGIHNFTTGQAYFAAINSNPSATWTAEQVLNNYVQTPTGTPGAAFGYSNTNFVLLGRIIEEVTDSAWYDVLRYRILEPNQLSSIYADFLENPTGVMPHNWQVVNGTPVDISQVPRTAFYTSGGAAGILASNPWDVARFAKLLFDGKILRPASLNKMLQFESAPSGSLFYGYGLGLSQISSLGNPVYGHGGNVPGFSSMMVYSPTDSIAVASFTNHEALTTPMALWMLQAAQQWITTTNAPALIAAEQPVLSIFPNPATTSGTVQFTLAKPGKFTLRLLNVLGQEITVLAAGDYAGAAQTVPVNFEGLPAGWYMCRLETDQGTVVKRWLIE